MRRDELQMKIRGYEIHKKGEDGDVDGDGDGNWKEYTFYLDRSSQTIFERVSHPAVLDAPTFQPFL